MKNEFESLKVNYDGEWKAYPIFYNKKIDSKDLQFIADKIARHFKLSKKPDISIFNYRGSRALKYDNYIKLSMKYGLDFGTLCHELNHFFCWNEQDKQRFSGKPIKRIRHGTKKWNRNLQKLFRYCQKKNFWEQEIVRRNEPIPAKPELTHEELISKTIERFERNCKRYTANIRMYQRKLHKAQLKIGRLRVKMSRI